MDFASKDYWELVNSETKYRKHKRAMVYAWWDHELSRYARFSLRPTLPADEQEEMKGMELLQRTVIFGPKYGVATDDQGERYICYGTDPDHMEFVAKDFDKTPAGSKASVTWTRQDGKTVRIHAETLDPQTVMKIVAYRSPSKVRKDRLNTWSLKPSVGSTPIMVYIPYCYKFVKTKERGLQIQEPSMDVWRVVTYPDGTSGASPDENDEHYISDFAGVGHDETPYIIAGSKRKSCYVALEDDIYTPLKDKTEEYVRLQDGRYRIDKLHLVPGSNGAGYWNRTIVDELPKRLQKKRPY